MLSLDVEICLEVVSGLRVLLPRHPPLATPPRDAQLAKLFPVPWETGLQFHDEGHLCYDQYRSLSPSFSSLLTLAFRFTSAALCVRFPTTGP